MTIHKRIIATLAILGAALALASGPALCAGGDAAIIADPLTSIVLTREAGGDGPALAPDDIPGYEELQQSLQVYLGKPLTMAQAQEIAAVISGHYVKQDAPFTTAYLPEQKIRDGAVRYVVVEPTINRITIQGARHFNDAQLISQIESQPGGRVNLSTMEQDVVWLNTPYRDVDLVLQKGASQGTVDMVVNVSDRDYESSWTGYSNYGNRLTGYNRFTMGYKHGNLGARDRELVYQFTSGESLQEYNSHYVGYTVPQHSMKSTISMFLHTSKSKFSFDTGGLTVNSSGSALQAGLRYSRPMQMREINQKNLVLGLDFKQFDNAYDYLFFGNPVAAAPSTNIDVIQFSAGIEKYRRYLMDNKRPGVFWANAMLYMSPGNLTAGSETAAYASSRPGADASYAYFKTSMLRDFMMRGGWKLTLNGSFQYAGKPLMGSEQISISGSGLVRGYDAGAVMGDKGYFLSMELFAPPSKPLNALEWARSAEENFRPSVFAEFGVVHDMAAAADGRVDAASLGIGFKHQIRDAWSLSAHFAWPLVDVPINTSVYKQHNTHAYLSLNILN